MNPAVTSLSVFFPCYNDQATIASMVNVAVATLERVGVTDAEVIVIDDGSTDQSPEVLTKLTREQPLLRIVTHPENRGYGGALISGFDAARTYGTRMALVASGVLAGVADALRDQASGKKSA